MNSTVLHQWKISPFCGKVRRILEIKGIEYTTCEYNGLRAPLAAKLSKAGKLPVLDINGIRIADSRKIAEYLERQYPQVALVPTDSKQRAAMEIYQDWADESLYWYNFYFRLMYDDAWEKVSDAFSEGRPFYEHSIVKIFGRQQYLKQLNGQGIGRAPKQQVEERFLMLIGQLEVLLAADPWLVGEMRTLADIAVAAQIDAVRRTSHLSKEIAGHKSVSAWLDRVQA